MRIPFNKPFLSGNEQEYVSKVITTATKFSGDGVFTKTASELLEKKLGARKVLLTTSCTHALEMAALLCDIHPGDEVIMPSYTFVSTANAFVLRGATIVWVDINPDHMNIDLEKVKAAITPRTKAICPVHYAGQSCNMIELMKIAKEHALFVIEDAAQSIGATHMGQALGTFGDLSALSFHDTKNLHCGEGGALVINNPEMIARAEIIREKGTNRSKFFRGEVDKYTWVDIGSSYLPSELSAAFLVPQLLAEEKVTAKRRTIWDRYSQNLSSAPGIKLMQRTSWNEPNGHIFYLLLASPKHVDPFIQSLKKNGIHTAFHYIPLHSSPFGKSVGYVSGSIKDTDTYAHQLVRMPMYYDLSLEEVDSICLQVQKFTK